MRDFSMVRKVCDSTAGRPLSARLSGTLRWLAIASAASNGTSGFTPSTSSAPASSATEACRVRRNAPST